MIETFMQNALLLIDNCFDVQHIMMSILADLSVINFMDFGISCFQTLKDLMTSGKELEAYVISIMQERVINTLKGAEPYSIPVALLQGLHQLIEETEDSEMLTPMFDSCFSTWIRTYEKKIKAAKKQKTLIGNDEHYDAVIQLLADSVNENDDNVECCKRLKLIEPICTILA